ncbi:hypothetical protein A2331_06690 [Candidatus Falkowbacteria bacterium RIFOXYB2_FULL_34_18]|uniref:Uncharacterized protein n=1 Tax=Candidatus Falkowbacteria bacterium RIFOXYD2_FULL_34_120 TaxID=1798007 RepID=A0A1F5TRK4_9BACT|nr:MAG: hypothetical protein A2331_06690 [Candidatus Falkowbacteria bacterium RIFOXYB2_FULL_34_18]OGF29992.1 MAG: hypothetical protein A2500_03990 [Candidatus Falkowbacteria bacterium RIFOXYC12_FULL_34_55]OGF37151.1 MAG: hypothetical protein A2466_02530 [Candidatus Falkowbacteria bacterium RIFOXYC2_FULL_34_220]OGF39528.1 MAG: hypothetical protein A2515_04355 [Candidatus Falkowbacteria bacterium RIFOXYD12_FULL_34_57]OGF41489.1 MAG: hypothetical protein A2531_02245 [Candidatus Falkowbacteria bact
MFKFNKKKIFLFSSFFLVFLVVGAIVFNLFIFNYAGYFRAKDVMATSGYSFLIGLSSSVAIQCFTTGTPPLCTGGTLCNIKDAARCAMYSDVSGSPSGGMGSNAIFLTSNLSAAGAAGGGPIIAGGMSMTEMDNGVIAGIGGCIGTGCTVGINNGDSLLIKTAKKFANFMIAGIK